MGSNKNSPAKMSNAQSPAKAPAIKAQWLGHPNPSPTEPTGPGPASNGVAGTSLMKAAAAGAYGSYPYSQSAGATSSVSPSKAPATAVTPSVQDKV